MIGAFHLPETIMINVRFLETLPDEEYKCGLGEIIKYGMINIDLFNSITGGKKMLDVVMECAEFKNSIVLNDFKESGIRQILNYGHGMLLRNITR